MTVTLARLCDWARKNGMATMAIGPVWTDHIQDGVTYSLNHVRPVFVDYAVPAIAATARKPGRAAKTLKVRIVYSHHCFTQAVEKVVRADPAHLYTCARRKEVRVFCPVRWNESLALPSIIAGMTSCFFTRHHNYFVWRNPTASGVDEYFVYFSVISRGSFVEIEIESAYPRADGAQVRKGAQKVSLTTLIVNAANGRKTHRPPA